MTLLSIKLNTMRQPKHKRKGPDQEEKQNLALILGNYELNVLPRNGDSYKKVWVGSNWNSNERPRCTSATPNRKG
nr:hypothetical protein CFP56_20603 [Quercus suber]